MPVITTLAVSGMTCGHCVSAVTNELGTVDGVERVSVELHKEGVSEVTVLSHETLDESALRAAIIEAGYEASSIDVDTEGLATQAAEQHKHQEEYRAQHPQG